MSYNTIVITNLIMDPNISLIQKNDIENFVSIDNKNIMINSETYLKACIYYEAYEIADYIILLMRMRFIPLDYLMRMAVVLNKPRFVSLFIENGARIHYLDDHALKIACCNGYYEIVKLLILLGADPKSNRDYCVIVAASNGHNKIINLLVSKGADVKANNNQAIRWAQINGHHDTVELLKSLGAIESEFGLPMTKYTETLEADEKKFWVTRKTYDVNNNLTSKHEFIYDN